MKKTLLAALPSAGSAWAPRRRGTFSGTWPQWVTTRGNEDMVALLEGSEGADVLSSGAGGSSGRPPSGPAGWLSNGGTRTFCVAFVGGSGDREHDHGLACRISTCCSRGWMTPITRPEPTLRAPGSTRLTCAGEPLYACCVRTGSCEMMTSIDCEAGRRGSFNPGQKLRCHVQCICSRLRPAAGDAIKNVFR